MRWSLLLEINQPHLQNKSPVSDSSWIHDWHQSLREFWSSNSDWRKQRRGPPWQIPRLVAFLTTVGLNSSSTFNLLMNHLHHKRSLPNDSLTSHSCLADHPSRYAPSLVHLLIKTLRSKRILIDMCEAVRGRLLPLALSSNGGFFCASSFFWRWWMTVLLPSWEVSRQPVWLTVLFFEKVSPIQVDFICL